MHDEANEAPVNLHTGIILHIGEVKDRSSRLSVCKISKYVKLCVCIVTIIQQMMKQAHGMLWIWTEYLLVLTIYFPLANLYKLVKTEGVGFSKM